MLTNFQQVLKTDSYVELCHTTLEKEKESQDGECSIFEAFGDQVGIILLRTVLDELRSIPSELIFLKPSNALSLSSLKME